ncbi:unnamed protein product [Meloidogyne enterolobii]|uniref:Uncharacterized protein n=1 Tax=Meloidogyne enterolobii TaxID=390850 RepID=A0ACB0ZMT6_MELEN
MKKLFALPYSLDFRAKIFFFSDQSCKARSNFLKNLLISKFPSVPSKSGIVSKSNFSMSACDAVSERKLAFCSIR